MEFVTITSIPHYMVFKVMYLLSYFLYKTVSYVQLFASKYSRQVFFWNWLKFSAVQYSGWSSSLFVFSPLLVYFLVSQGYLFY